MPASSLLDVAWLDFEAESIACVPKVRLPRGTVSRGPWPPRFGPAALCECSIQVEMAAKSSRFQIRRVLEARGRESLHRRAIQLAPPFHHDFVSLPLWPSRLQQSQTGADLPSPSSPTLVASYASRGQGRPRPTNGEGPAISLDSPADNRFMKLVGNRHTSVSEIDQSLHRIELCSQGYSRKLAKSCASNETAFP